MESLIDAKHSIVMQCWFWVFLLFGGPSQAGIHLTPVTLELKSLPQFQFAGFYAAKEKGFYSDAGLDVTINPRGSEILPVDQVLQGESEFAVSDSSLIYRRLRGEPVVVLAAIFQHSPMVLITREDSEIYGLAELKGRRIMRQKNPDDAVITAMLFEAGLTSDDVEDIPHTFDDFSLVNKETDAITAYLTNQPYFYKEQGVAIRTINPLNYGLDFYGDMIVTRESLIKKDPQLVLAFREASIKGWEYALNHPEEIIGVIKNKYQSASSIERLRFEAEMTAKMIATDLIDIGYINPARFERIASIYKKLHLAPSAGNLDGVYYLDYLKKKSIGNLKGVIFIVLIFATGVFIAIYIIRHLSKVISRQDQAIVKRNKEMKSYINVVDRYVITSSTDVEGRITKASEAFCKISKYSKSELIGQTHNIVRHPAVPSKVYEDMWRTISSGQPWVGEFINLAKDGSEYWVRAFIEPDFDQKGTIIGYTAIRDDITDRKRVEKLSVTDPLSGLFNRLKLDELAGIEQARSERSNNPFVMIMLDIDHFKTVNDNYGHQVGDAVLIQVAKTLSTNCRSIDFCGRWGGEEFMIICPQTDLVGGGTVSEKIRKAIEQHTFPEVGRITASFGVTQWQTGMDINKLTAQCDQALYQAKDRGRNCSVFYEVNPDRNA